MKDWDRFICEECKLIFMAKEGNKPYPKCPNCDYFVNVWHARDLTLDEYLKERLN